MYLFLAFLTGVLISGMVSINGSLTGSFGVFYASVIIHVVGVLFALLLCLLKKERIRVKTPLPFWAYLGGAIGVLTTLFNNYAYARLSVTSIVALGLLGQCVTSNILDAFGMFGMKKRPIREATWFGLALSFLGVFIMMDYSVSGGLAAGALSLGAGVTVVMARTVNARLAGAAGPLAGSFYNHLVGLPICVILALLVGRAGIRLPSAAKPWMLCGGMFGVLAVALFNITVPRISAFRQTLISFLGQLFSGIILDFACGRAASPRLFWGGVLIAAGLLTDMIILHATEKRLPH